MDAGNKARAFVRAAGWALKAALKGLAGYLADWRNLLGHASLGIILLAAAIWVPVPPLAKLAFVAALVAFNIARGRRARAKRAGGPKPIPGAAPGSDPEGLEEPV